MGPHLVMALSSHGFGHIGQTAPLIEPLRARVPNLKMTVRTAAPLFKLIERFGKDVAIVHAQTDVGMVQHDAQCVALEETAQAYSEFHQDWDRRVDEEARALRGLGADALLANVPYLALGAAQRARIPALALCSINWMDIYAHFLDARPEAPTILEQMRTAYASACVFLQPTPSMPMGQLDNRRSIGPFCQRGKGRRAWLIERCGLHPDERLVMVSLGGMELRPGVDRWPTLSRVRFIVPASWGSTHPSTLDFESLGLPYLDALWSCDALVCKPGYGSLVEAACAGLPVLYVDRPNWPEAPYLVRWLERVGRCAPLTHTQWFDGDFMDILKALWATASPAPVVPVGVHEAVAVLTAMLT